jgi:tryptophan synthase
MCFELLKKARAAGLTVPVIFMGYYNPVAAFGEEKYVEAAKDAGAHGVREPSSL